MAAIHDAEYACANSEDLCASAREAAQIRNMNRALVVRAELIDSANTPLMGQKWECTRLVSD